MPFAVEQDKLHSQRFTLEIQNNDLCYNRGLRSMRCGKALAVSEPDLSCQCDLALPVKQCRLFHCAAQCTGLRG